MWSKYEKELSDLFDELVPACGKADSKAGEIVRATNRIIYRYFNDGDQVGIGYGKETCNPAARFLIHNGSKEVAEVVRKLWGEYIDEKYEGLLDDLGKAVIDMLEQNPNLRNEETQDMFDYYDKSEDVDDEYEEEEEDWYEDEYEETEETDDEW